jgi:hypothetical protein
MFIGMDRLLGYYVVKPTLLTSLSEEHVPKIADRTYFGIPGITRNRCHRLRRMDPIGNFGMSPRLAISRESGYHPGIQPDKYGEPVMLGGHLDFKVRPGPAR